MWWCRFLLELCFTPLLELCFVGCMAKDKTCSPPSQGDSCPKLTLGTCNPVNSTVLKPSDWTRGHNWYKDRWKGPWPWDSDAPQISNWYPWEFLMPSSSLLLWENEEWVFHLCKNLFLSLAESQRLNVTSCYVCGGTNMGDHWPWEARELDPWEPFNETAFPKHRKDV
jgi:hypothetical protein